MDTIAFAKFFVDATVEVLSTMAGITPKAGKPYVKKDDTACGDLTAIVGVTGERCGSIAVTFPRDTAVAVVQGMLGDDIGDLMQDTRDTVGEVTNMISGHARAKLSESGCTMQGSTPIVVTGASHSVSHLSQAPVMALPFSTDVGEFTVEFCLE